MDKTDRLRDYGLAFLLYEHGLGVCGYELIRELFIFIKLILNSYLIMRFIYSQKYDISIYLPKILVIFNNSYHILLAISNKTGLFSFK